ncbi:hypothetical protein FRC09_001905 [Ceratobasidium sp. 395]|nr:hypothetical protein FRC09_001905 [Ceratobasidium sp. 395]
MEKRHRYLPDRPQTSAPSNPFRSSHSRSKSVSRVEVEGIPTRSNHAAPTSLLGGIEHPGSDESDSSKNIYNNESSDDDSKSSKSDEDGDEDSDD